MYFLLSCSTRGFPVVLIYRKSFLSYKFLIELSMKLFLGQILNEKFIILDVFPVMIFWGFFFQGIKLYMFKNLDLIICNLETQILLKVYFQIKSRSFNDFCLVSLGLHKNCKFTYIIIGCKKKRNFN